MIKRILTLSLFLSSLFSIALGQIPGSLDLSFNKTGQSLFALKANSTEDYASATLLQPDGKLLVAGYYSSSQNGEAFVTRWLANGKPDPSFGINGKVRISDLNIIDFVANAMALQSNGNIVLAGHLYQSTSESIPAITCLKADGSINTEFGNDGFMYFFQIPSGLPATLKTVNIHPATGHIIACGQTTGLQSGNLSDMLVICIDQYGNSIFDKSPAYKTYDIGGFSSNITSAVQFHADSLYLGVNQFDGEFTTMGVTALSMVTGQLTDFFGDENVLLLASSNYDNSYCSSIALTAGKDILLAGSAYDGSSSKMLVCKIKASKESKDLLFGTDGQTHIQFGSATEQKAYSIAVDKNNHIVLGGYYRALNDKSYWAAAGLDSEGELASGLGAKTFAVEDYNMGIVSIQALSSGEYLLAGTSNGVNSDVLLKKISNSGEDVLAYGKNSQVNTWAKDYRSTGQDLALRSDGKLWVCGILPSNSDLDRQSGIALLNADGTLDESFGGAGQAPSGVYLVPQTINSQVLYGLQLTSIKIQGSKLLVAGTYFEASQFHLPILMRFIISGNTLTPDDTFGNGTGMVILNNGNYYNYVQGLVLQDNTNILVYGYLTDSKRPAVICYSKDGVLSPTFAGNTGIYTSERSTTVAVDGENEKTMDLKSWSDNSILAATTTFSGETNDFLVFKLSSDGTELMSNLYDIAGEDKAYSLAIKPDKSFLVGGSTGSRYTIVAYLSDGTIDDHFGTEGKWSVPNVYTEAIVGLHIDGLKLVALGLSFNSEYGIYSRSVFRLTMAGKLDDTFYGKGYHLYGKGWAYNSVIANNRLYAFGPDQKVYGSTNSLAQVDKLYLGSGPVIRATTLQLGDLQKTFGDPVFTLQPVSNSPAPVQYTITHGSCASVNATSGEVTIKCVPLNSDQYIEIKAYQPAISGYTEDDVFIRLSVAQAIPKIIFVKQGGVVDSTIVLRVIVDSDGSINFEEYSDPNNAVEYLGDGNVLIQKDDCAQIRVTVGPTQNYLEGTSIASICGYLIPIPPDAADDEIVVQYSPDAKIVIKVLANDEGNTGTIVASSVDLDPAKPGIQKEVYPLGGIGKFTVDTLGYVTYIPFIGFLGSGEISYTIHDSQNMESSPAKIKVTQTAAPNAPLDDLKATELFTPNDDGLNDAFVIGHREPGKNSTLKIFDRNGQQLFTVDNYNNDWTGVLPNGNFAESGIYYYVFQETSGRELKGVVELRR